MSKSMSSIITRRQGCQSPWAHPREKILRTLRLCSRQPRCILKDAINNVLEKGNLGNYKYLHFSMVVDGHKMLPISGCSLAGGKHICGERLASSHAEMNALKSVKYNKLNDRKKASKLIVVVVRFDATKLLEGIHVLLDSKPCYHCLTTMRKFGIDKVLYSCKGMADLTTSSVTTLLKSKDYVVSTGHRAHL